MVKSASRVLDIMELISISPEPLRFTDIILRLEIPKSSAFAILQTLFDRGYVNRYADGRYSINGTTQGLWAYQPHARLVQIARPVLQGLVQRTGHSAFIGILTPDKMVQYIDKIVSDAKIRYERNISKPRPAYCVSTGLVLLAFQKQSVIDEYILRTPLKRHTKKTVTDPVSLHAELKKIKKKGYAENRGGRISEASGAAAPVFSLSGKVVAAINVAGPASQYLQNRKETIDAMVNCAKEISQFFGAIEGQGASSP